MYKGSKREYISVYSNNARFTGKPRESTTAFKSQDLKKLTHYLIDNACIKLGNKIVRQVIGIFIGIDCAPFLANADLYVDEFKFQEKMTRQNYGVAKSLNNTSRYLDDLGSLNDKGNFSNL